MNEKRKLSIVTMILMYILGWLHFLPVTTIIPVANHSYLDQYTQSILLVILALIVAILLFISGYGILKSYRWGFYMGLALSVFIILATIIPVLMNPSIVEIAPLWMNLISWGTFCLSLIIIFCLFLLRTEFLVAKTNEK